MNFKNHKINFDPWVSMFRLSARQYQGNVFVMIFALFQRVVPLFCRGHLQLFPAAWGKQCWPVLGLSFLDVYGQIIEKYCGCYCQQNVLTYLGLALRLGNNWDFYRPTQRHWNRACWCKTQKLIEGSSEKVNRALF